LNRQGAEAQSQRNGLRRALFVKGYYFAEEGAQFADGDVFARVDEEDFHSGALFLDQFGMVDAGAFNDTDIRLFVFLWVQR
jgi:hypothetical protein